MKKTPSAVEKPLINHRWVLPSLENMIDEMLPEWPDGQHPDFSGPDGHAKMKRALLRFGERLLRQLRLVMEKAAGKGIEQALNLVRDPSYAQTVKRRTKRQIQQQQEDFKRQDEARERWRRFEFSYDEKIRELARLDREINYHEKHLQESRERQAKVQSVIPSSFDTDLVKENLRPTFESDDDGDDNEWPDRISFD